MISSQRQLQIQDFAQSLNDEELRALYHQLGDRLRLAHRAKELYAMKDFHILDRVSFHYDGRHIEGTVMRLNQRTISVLSADGVRWKVSPHLLKKLDQEAGAEEDAEDIALSLTMLGAAKTPLTNASKQKYRPKNKNRHD